MSDEKKPRTYRRERPDWEPGRYESVAYNGVRVIEYGPVLYPANPHTRAEVIGIPGEWSEEKGTES